MLTEPERALVRIAEILDREELAYAVGGSVASGHHGEMRATNDVDLLIELPAGRVAALAAALTPEFDVHESSMRDAVRLGRSFSAVHMEWMLKVDFFVAGDRLLDRLQLSRRRPLRVGGPEGRDVQFTSPEDIVLRKPDWLPISGGVLERQRRDALGVLKVVDRAIDVHYLRTTAAILGLRESVEALLRDAGLAT